MTEEQQQLLIEASAPLLINPQPWVELSQELKELFYLLFPRPSFSDEQRYWLQFWWLPVTNEIVDQLNALCPPMTQVSTRVDVEGNQFIPASLLSDAVDGRRLSMLLPILQLLPLAYKAEEDWPIPENDDL
jgi:hypothetical protein